MTALVRIEADRVVADSRDVASEFGKRHDHVLRSIDKMVREQSELAPNFGVVLYPAHQGNGAIQHRRRFDMDRKGFMLLVMGFSGAKALAIKSRWIDAFDAMEQLLRSRDQAGNDDERLPGALPSLNEATRIGALGEVYRRIYGVAEARWIMQKYGLPVPPLALATGPQLPYLNNVTDWVEQCCERDPLAREEAMELYRNYQTWCSEQQQVAENQTSFGRSLGRLGFPPKKTSRVHRTGLRLIR